MSKKSKTTQALLEKAFQGKRSIPTWRERAIVILAGKGWGKTTLCSRLPGAFIIETDYRGADFVTSCPVYRCHRWDYIPTIRKGESANAFAGRFASEVEGGNIGFLQLMELVLDKHEPGSIAVIDTVTELHSNMINDFCKEHNVDTLPDDYGRTHIMLKRQFADAFKILMSKFGIIWTAHVKEEDFKTRAQTLSKVRPDVPKLVWDVLRPAADVIFYGLTKSVTNKKTGEKTRSRYLTSEIMEHLFDSGGRFQVPTFKATAENYVSELTEAIERQLKT